jgi:hypothetical protein
MLILPGSPFYSIPTSVLVENSRENALVIDSETGLPRAANLNQVFDYMLGGEYELVSENQEELTEEEVEKEIWDEEDPAKNLVFYGL